LVYAACRACLIEMRFLVDECTGPAVARWLSGRGEDVFSVYDEARGATDDWIVQKAYEESRILITNDKDFGEKIFRDHQPHCGIIFLRLENERYPNKISVLAQLFENHLDRFANNFVVVTEQKVRIVPPRSL